MVSRNLKEKHLELSNIHVGVLPNKVYSAIIIIAILKPDSTLCMYMYITLLSIGLPWMWNMCAVHAHMFANKLGYTRYV